MRRWRAADGVVVAELGDGRFAIVRDGDGSIDRMLEPHADSIDDDYYAYAYDVAGGALWLRVEVRTFGEEERRREDRVEVAGWTRSMTLSCRPRTTCSRRAARETARRARAKTSSSRGSTLACARSRCLARCAVRSAA